MRFSAFRKNKDNILDDISAQLKAMERIVGQEIQVWRQDNAGETKVLEKNMAGEHWKFKNKLNYTATGTPHQNAYTEMGFTIQYNLEN